MFHVSQLKKFAENITFRPHPRCNVDYENKSLKNKEIPLVMVLWEESQPIEASWEMESGIWESYPYLFSYVMNPNTLHTHMLCVKFEMRGREANEGERFIVHMAVEFVLM
ncbi:hypothetical protein KIW84_063743 [Lathyrus oleraceus]|uniref:Uncharacterized protein n=1 Tax=Pisum sativum TaxID=3888 RepID=A0A9D4W8E8_PEA|nr:hypothetical protein KIW84_063743 [Pisum sativum]